MLLFTVGLPRCGKSTYCNDWVKQSPKRAIVCADDIRMSLTGQRYNYLTETMVFAIKHVMIRSLLRRGMDVIVDGTHTTEISWQRIFEIDINASPVFYPDWDNGELCKKRAVETKQDDLIPVIDRMKNNMYDLWGEPFTIWDLESYKQTIIRKVKGSNFEK